MQLRMTNCWPSAAAAAAAALPFLLQLLLLPSLLLLIHCQFSDCAAVQLDGSNQGQRNYDSSISDSLQANILELIQDHNDTRLSREKRSPIDSALTLSHSKYLSFSEINAALIQLRNKCNDLKAGACEIKELGRTEQRRPINALTINMATSRPFGPREERHSVWMDGGVHAREWISSATVLFIADVLITRGMQEGSNLLRNSHQLDFVIVPMLNPDGYHYSMTANRMWRKNRQRFSATQGSCLGTDINRNFGFDWGRTGSSDDKCSDIYHGEAPFSSQEAAAVRDLIMTKSFSVFLSFHAYGRMILVPFGSRTEFYPEPEKRRKISCAAIHMSHKMVSKHRVSYMVGTGADLLYEAGGSSEDWAHASANVLYSMIIELGSDAYGFQMPPHFIPKIGQEAVTGVTALLEVVSAMGVKRQFSSSLAEGFGCD